MLLSQLKEDTLSDEITERLLFGGLEYGGQSADIILVLGSRKACINRVPLAAELYLAGKAPKLMLCGGKVQDTPLGRMAEYEAMRAAAEEKGVPARDILTERRSMDTEENMLFAREMISKELPGCGRIILVTAAFHMRRALLLARMTMPEQQIIPAPAHRGVTRDNWNSFEKGRHTARAECRKLIYSAAHGLIEDMEIQL